MQWALLIFAVVILGLAVAAVVWLWKLGKAQGELKLELAQETAELGRVRELLEIERKKNAALEGARQEVLRDLDAYEEQLVRGSSPDGRSVLDLLRARLSEAGL